MEQTTKLYNAGKVTIIAFLIFIIFASFSIVNPGERGVLLKLGQVQEEILGEGIHLITPIVNTVRKLSIQVQNEQITAEVTSKDIQKVFADVALNWHLIPEKVNIIYQQIGNEQDIVLRILNPTVKEVLKTVMARYAVEEIVTKSSQIKAETYDLLTAQLAIYNLGIDDIFIIRLQFTKEFETAVEAKQIAEQSAKRAAFLVLKALKDAEAKVNLAKGETEAQRLLSETLNPEILQKQAIEKWDGKLPLIVDKNGKNLFDVDLDTFLKGSKK